MTEPTTMTAAVVLPDARIIPTGGIPLRDVGAWLGAGAMAVGVGSDLYGALDVPSKVAELRAMPSEPR